jgi:hypothetical protein
MNPKKPLHKTEKKAARKGNIAEHVACRDAFARIEEVNATPSVNDFLESAEAAAKTGGDFVIGYLKLS